MTKHTHTKCENKCLKYLKDADLCCQCVFELSAPPQAAFGIY